MSRTRWYYFYHIIPNLYTLIRFVLMSAKFDIFSAVGLNDTLVKAKIHTWDT